MVTAITAFVLFYFFALSADFGSRKHKLQLLQIACVALALIAGFRNPNWWSDTIGYNYSFTYATNSLFDYSFSDRPWGYTEKGFYFLGVIVKTFTDNPTVYFLFISCLTWIFLYKYFHKYCALPLIGLCVYIARFYSGRNMIQIRECLAIPIVLLASEHIVKREFWKFMIYVVIGYQFHRSAIFAVPLYFLNWYDFKKKHIYWGIFASFAFAFVFGGWMKNFVSTSQFFLSMAQSYVAESSEKAFGYGLANPMIYYQTFLLLIFTYFEDRFKGFKDYYFLRTAYFYSTVVLIILCDFAVLSARLSTVYATFETLIIPVILLVFKKEERMLPALAILGVLLVFFYTNFKSYI